MATTKRKKPPAENGLRLVESRAPSLSNNQILLAHTADWHLMEGPKFEQTLFVLRWLVADAIKRGARLFLCLGDISGIPVPHNMTTYEELALINVYQTAGDHMPVVILKGNHDAFKDLDVFREIRAHHSIYVVDRPQRLTIPTEKGNVYVCCLPYPSKSWMKHEVPGGIAGEKTWMEGGLRTLLHTWKGELDGPKIFAGHLNIAGSKVAGGEVMVGQEIELAPHDLDELNMDYIALGHIHMDQQICMKGGYAGSPDRSNFGETDEKSYRLVLVTKGEMPQIERRMTPAKPYKTVEATWLDGAWIWDQPLGELKGAEVKLRYHYKTDGTAPDVQTLVDLIRDKGGALSVILDARPEQVVRLRSEEIMQATTVEEKVVAYWNSLGDKGPPEEVRQRCLSKIGELRNAPPHP